MEARVTFLVDSGIIGLGATNSGEDCSCILGLHNEKDQPLLRGLRREEKQAGEALPACSVYKLLLYER